MYKKFISVLFLSIILCLFVFYICFDKNSKTVNTSVKNRVLVFTSIGHFVGNKLEYQNRRVNVFLGIPYSLPPIGSLRFQKPIPLSDSNHTFDANRWPNPCLQKDNHLRLNNYNFSEDCLYLNIWSPRTDNSTTLAPVVVHIHTGAFLFGSASETAYNGLVLSALGDVVVVTFNYRLNLYGFLYTGANEVTPNAGMYDQVLALQWVRQHISHFGGDANRVTLFGQSTGAVSVGLHILSPISNNLFESAVMISGSPLQHIWFSEPETAEEFWIKYAKEVKCIRNGGNMRNSKVLECLTQISRNQLPAMTDCKRYSADPFVVSAPVVFDNQFRPRNSIKYSINKNISILFGYTDDEGSWMLALEDRYKYGPKVEQNMSFEEAVNELKKFLKKMKTNTNNEIKDKDIVNHYFNSIANNQRTDKNLLSRTIGRALGDFYISCPLHSFIDSLFKNSNNSKIYQYLWSYKGNPKSSSFWRTFEDVWCGHWMGSCHSFELYSIFGTPFLQSLAFNDIDRRISIKMIEMISNFAYNNKPKSVQNIEWLEFNEMNRNIEKPYHVINYGLNSKQIYGKNLKKYECNSLWNQWIND